MTKTRIGLIFGGKSTEHEVSLQSARNIYDALDRSRYEIVLIGIDRHGQWQLSDAADYLQNADDPSTIALVDSDHKLALAPGRPEGEWLRIQDHQTDFANIDVAFPIVHGATGEDGSLQGLLKILDIPQVGSGVLGSAACMDKDITKRLLRDAGIAVAPFITIKKSSLKTLDLDAVIAELGLPLFVKPVNQGSSVGVSKVKSKEELLPAIHDAFRFDRKVLIETGIDGREIECAVLGNETPEASVCGEVILSDEFYSYDTKYISQTGASVDIPANITQRESDAIRQTALKAFNVLECLGLARVDVFLTPEGQVIVNEINTLPGFTRISMYPKLWEATGLSYTPLLTRLIDLAIENHAVEGEMRSNANDVASE
ncbi:D-alanine--D-alanine ligase A [Halomonadaceae bacterium LMG 33818]|uniref:D-alanine--D-alanine ligase n=1 Tax=Cernens ardua TaxID=3402176 RepID=UPI003EDB95E7